VTQFIPRLTQLQETISLGVSNLRLTGRNWWADAENVWSKKKKKALRTPTPGGIYGGQGKMLTSFQIEIFLGFYLTAKLCDLNHTLRSRPLPTPPKSP
jgi:hypothetical protein